MLSFLLRSKLTRFCWLGMEDLKEGKEATEGAMGPREPAGTDSWRFFSSLQMSSSLRTRPWTLEGCPHLTGTSYFPPTMNASLAVTFSVNLLASRAGAGNLAGYRARWCQQSGGTGSLRTQLGCW